MLVLLLLLLLLTARRNSSRVLVTASGRPGRARARLGSEKQQRDQQRQQQQKQTEIICFLSCSIWIGWRLCNSILLVSGGGGGAAGAGAGGGGASPSGSSTVIAGFRIWTWDSLMDFQGIQCQKEGQEDQGVKELSPPRPPRAFWLFLASPGFFRLLTPRGLLAPPVSWLLHAPPGSSWLQE